jgi:chromosome segregation ATPase
MDSMKNFSKLSQEPQLMEDISKNQHIVKGLRDKIELLTKNYNVLMEKYRGLQIAKGKTQLGQNEEKSLSERIDELEGLVLKKEQDIIELKQSSAKADSLIQSLKDKNKELEDEISKWQNYQLPKIKELEQAQKALLDEFNKTKRDFETYSNLYQAESEEKKKAYSDVKQERNRLTEMANILGRERRKIKELNAELVRKDEIIYELVDKAPEL